MVMNISHLFSNEVQHLKSNLIIVTDSSEHENQSQNNESYSLQWKMVDEIEEKKKAWAMQKRWYLELYGFKTEANLKSFLTDKQVILDAGCGLGYKAAWFAELAPHATVIGMDFSESVYISSEYFQTHENLLFVRGDIADTGLKDNVIDYVSCDQVLQHTEVPENTLAEFNRILNPAGKLAVYVYRKKALPRELLDTHFREKTKELSYQEKLEFSAQLTELGRKLSELHIELDFPDIPVLGIKGGKQDLQRFIYWNFIKCFWNPELGEEISNSTNFDWYSPSNAYRYSKSEFIDMLANAGFDLDFLHEEEACYSGVANLLPNA